MAYPEVGDYPAEPTMKSFPNAHASEEPTGLNQAVERIKEAAERYDDAVSRLRNRVEPLMIPERPSDSVSPNAPVFGSPATVKIMELAAWIERSTDVLNSTTSRIL